MRAYTEELLKGRPVAVIGAGLVGGGWAIVFAQAGLQVRIYDANADATDRALALIAEQLKELNTFGLVDDPIAIAARIKPAYQLAEAVEGAAYAQESVLERVELKRSFDAGTRESCSARSCHWELKFRHSSVRLHPWLENFIEGFGGPSSQSALPGARG